jgi:NTP pyrophosphatase (non-canonical NTP hydrolase)
MALLRVASSDVRYQDGPETSALLIGCPRTGIVVDEFAAANCTAVGPVSAEELSAGTIAAEKFGEVDFVWMCSVAPNAAEQIFLGMTKAHGIPVYAQADRGRPGLLPPFVSLVNSPLEACDHLRRCPRNIPTTALASLQRYYRRTAIERGYASEDARDCILLLTEEVGELARAVRKHIGLSRAGEYPQTEIGEELADVQLYLLHLANILQIDLPAAVASKERSNHGKFMNQQAVPTTL